MVLLLLLVTAEILHLEDELLHPDDAGVVPVDEQLSRTVTDSELEPRLLSEVFDLLGERVQPLEELRHQHHSQRIVIRSGRANLRDTSPVNDVLCVVVKGLSIQSRNDGLLFPGVTPELSELLQGDVTALDERLDLGTNVRHGLLL